jgi:hypothetical protein
MSPPFLCAGTYTNRPVIASLFGDATGGSASDPGRDPDPQEGSFAQMRQLAILTILPSFQPLGEILKDLILSDFPLTGTVARHCASRNDVMQNSQEKPVQGGAFGREEVVCGKRQV